MPDSTEMPDRRGAKNGIVMWKQTLTLTLLSHTYILKDIKFSSLEH
jgi:hypothetical protein